MISGSGALYSLLWWSEVCWSTHCGLHDDVIKWKHFPRHWPFVRGIYRSPVNSPHKGQWRGALMFSLICVWINGWVNNREAGDLRLYRAHCDVIVMLVSSYNELDLGWTLAQIMACRPTSPSHYLNRSWLIISQVRWHSSEGSFTWAISAINH